MNVARFFGVVVLLGCGRTGLERPDAGSAPVADAGLVTTDEIAPGLSGLRWELPCIRPDSRGPDYICEAPVSVTTTAQLQGVPGATYDIHILVRGVAETKQYSLDAPPKPSFAADGTSNPSDPWNEYSLHVSNPAHTYYLNDGPSGLYRAWSVHYFATFRAAAGATITLSAASFDRTECRNIDEALSPIVPPEVAPYLKAFDGQFLQMNVVGITRVP